MFQLEKRTILFIENFKQITTLYVTLINRLLTCNGLFEGSYVHSHSLFGEFSKSEKYFGRKEASLFMLEVSLVHPRDNTAGTSSTRIYPKQSLETGRWVGCMNAQMISSRPIVTDNQLFFFTEVFLHMGNQQPYLLEASSLSHERQRQQILAKGNICSGSNCHAIMLDNYQWLRTCIFAQFQLMHHLWFFLSMLYLATLICILGYNST